MNHNYIDLRTLKYFLFDLYTLEDLFELDYFSDHDRESMDLYIEAVKDLSDQALFPYFQEMDENPAHFKDNEVVVHEAVETMMRQAGDMGMIGATLDSEFDGLQTPLMVHTAIAYIQDAANNHLPGYWGLTLGAAELIIHFGDQKLKDQYVPKMLSGDWGGTMCLTEPEAGSSLSDLVTTAYATDQDYYHIRGQKIFISGGDHTFNENFVHLVLARIEGAPQGTKGISLFVVPKNRPAEDGLLVSNDVITAGDFQKLGQKGYCTTHLVFGEQEDCRGWLVGRPNEGLKYMFKMMNGARIAVGRGAAAIAMAAYQASLQYALERAQGRPVNQTGQKDPNTEQTLIINHADVRRMLLFQKSVVEGSLALVLKASKYEDWARQMKDPQPKEKYSLLVEFLTPIVKTYPSEMGFLAVSNGLQVLGGYGYTSEYILQQYLRDIRIFSIYEGTTGIQAIDLLGRKMLIQEGRGFKYYCEEIGQVIAKAKESTFSNEADQLQESLQTLQQTFMFLQTYLKDRNFESYLADANLFLEMAGHVTIAWLWLEIALDAHSKKPMADPFYENKIHTMHFYFAYELPKILSLNKSILSSQGLTIGEGSTLFK